MNIRRTAVDRYFSISQEIEKLEEERKTLRPIILEAVKASRFGRVAGKLAVAIALTSQRTTIDRKALEAELTRRYGADAAKEIITAASRVTQYDILKVDAR